MFLCLALIDNEEDKLKFEKLYNEYKQIMFYVANKILNDTYLAEDAVHLAFIRIAKNIDKIDLGVKHKTKKFIVVVTKNVAIDMYNKIIKENSIQLKIYYEKFQDLEKGEDVISDKILLAIDSLNPNYKNILSLKYSQGYTDKEIAQILEIREENVRKRLSRAKIKLKNILVEEVNINDK